jgi:uncharacterized protein YecE (DUF72 family)
VKSDLYIGCSGYAYPAWNNDFYPSKTPSSARLRYYASHFPTTEVNSTFYHFPKAATLQKMYDETPADFKFALKAGQKVTHYFRLKGMQDEITRFCDHCYEHLKEKVLAFLFQLPPSFAFNEENFDRLMETIPSGKENVVEFRHASWWNDRVYDALREKQITMCNIDSPRLSPEFVSLTPLFYLRMHGNPIMFTSSYTPEKLAEVAARIPADAEQILAYFNNTVTPAAIGNARELQQLIHTKQNDHGKP